MAALHADTCAAVAEPQRVIELGWLVATELDGRQLRAVEEARELVSEFLSEAFPQFDWRLPLLVEHSQPSEAASPLDEPAVRLLEGAQVRESRGWDFAVVVTGADLRSHYQSYALAVPSRSLATAVLSLARLSSSGAARASPRHRRGGHRSGSPRRGQRSAEAQPLSTQSQEPETRLAEPDAAAVDALPRRIAVLALHLFGDLNGLWHREAGDAVMRPPTGASDLDRPLDPEGSLSPEEVGELAAALDEVADVRLEEREETSATALFYARAAWERRSEILSSVLQARPWEMPLRLARLTTAALSALLVLLMTGEVWDLGTSQSAAAVIVLSLLTLGATSGFVLIRQRLLLRRARRTLTEQTVVTHVTAVLVVTLGFVTTYALLFAISAAAGATLFGPELVARWAPAVGSGEGWLRHLAVLSAMVAAVGLAIGALGASFEGNRYFLHVIYADEET